MNSEHGIDAHTVIIEQKLTYNGIDIDEVIKMNNDLQCCGNCVALYSSCPQMKEQDLLPYNSCEHWQWDNMTIEERIKD